MHLSSFARGLSLALALLATVTVSSGNFSGNAKSYPQTGKRLTPFKSGKYELRDTKGNAEAVTITRLTTGQYRVEGRNRNAIATFYPNTRGSYVMVLREANRYGYFIAVPKSGGVRVYDTSYAAHNLPEGKSPDNIPTALENLPYGNDAAKNKAFLQRLYTKGDRGFFQTIFTAVPVK